MRPPSASIWIHAREVKRFILEANGDFTLINEPKPGLATIPGWDEDFLLPEEYANTEVCSTCVTDQKNGDRCENCGSNSWQRAVFFEKKE